MKALIVSLLLSSSILATCSPGKAYPVPRHRQIDWNAHDLCKITEQQIEMRLRLPMPLEDGDPGTSWADVKAEFLEEKRSAEMMQILDAVEAADPADKWTTLVDGLAAHDHVYECDALESVLSV